MLLEILLDVGCCPAEADNRRRAVIYEKLTKCSTLNLGSVPHRHIQRIRQKASQIGTLRLSSVRHRSVVIGWPQWQNPLPAEMQELASMNFERGRNEIQDIYTDLYPPENPFPGHNLRGADSILTPHR
jgi:hypothetical protein